MIDISAFIDQFKAIADNADERMAPILEQLKAIEKERNETTLSITNDAITAIESDKESVGEIIANAQAGGELDGYFASIEALINGEFQNDMQAHMAYIFYDSIPRKLLIKSHVGKELHYAIKAEDEMNQLLEGLEGEADGH